MCGAYGFTIKKAKEVYARFGIQNTLDTFKTRYNIRPGQLNPVVTNTAQTTISLMFWGLIPHFAHDEHYKYKTINAKAKTVAKLPSFRE
jgi:putative SOS response-associated peptidase YedK